jgi:hypothetical protein
MVHFSSSSDKILHVQARETELAKMSHQCEHALSAKDMTSYLVYVPLDFKKGVPIFYDSSHHRFVARRICSSMYPENES